MGGVFACPKCGCEVALRGLSPGRQVQCGWCETWIEVPFIPRSPRALKFRRSRGRRPRWVPAAWLAIALASIVTLVVGGTHWMRARARTGRERVLTRLTASARAADKSGRLEQSVAEFEAALIVAREIDGGRSARIDDLVRLRDAAARREVKAHLAGLARAEPFVVVGECLTLLERIRKLPALEDLEEPVRSELDRACRRSVELDTTAARLAFEAGRPADALQLCDRISKTADHLGPQARRHARDNAKSLVTQIVEKHGLVLLPIRGRFALGTAASYTNAILPLLSDQLKPHGYLICPANSEWSPLWDRLAPYQMQVDVSELQSEYYMQSRNRMSRITARVSLSGRGTSLWERTVNARTNAQLPHLSAFQGSRMAMSDRPSPAFERLLYDDAHAMFLDQLSKALRTVPDRDGTILPAAVGAPSTWGNSLAGAPAGGT